jgi:hypothetical protein
VTAAAVERIFSPAALDDLLAAPTARNDLSVMRGRVMIATDCSSLRFTTAQSCCV